MAVSIFNDPSHQEEFGDVREYQSVSVPAVVSFILGIASVLSLLHIILVGIPIAGLAASCLALSRTRDTAATGRAFAVVGLFLSTFVGTFALARYTTHQLVVRDFAQEVAEKWIDLVQSGQLRRAHQWSMSASLRIAREELLDEYYANNPISERAMRKLFQKDGLRELVAFGTRGTVRLNGKRQIQQDRREQIFEFDYVLTGDNQEISLPLVVVRRWNLDFLRYDWLINPREEKPSQKE